MTQIGGCQGLWVGGMGRDQRAIHFKRMNFMLCKFQYIFFKRASLKIVTQRKPWRAQ